MHPAECSYPVPCPNQSSCPYCKEIRRLTAQMGLMKKLFRFSFARQKLVQLETRKRGVLTSLNAQRDPITTKLPVEVVRMIFHAYVGLHPIDTVDTWHPWSRFGELASRHFSDKMSFDSFQATAHFRLGGVCRQWRTIAWGDTTMWDTVDINFHGPHSANVPGLVAEWISRSGELPLHIRIRYRGHLADGTWLGKLNESRKTIFKEVATHISRWKSIDFDITIMFASLRDEAIRQLLLHHSPKPFTRFVSLQHLALLEHIDSPHEIYPYFQFWRNISCLHLSDMDAQSAWRAIEMLASLNCPIEHLGLKDIHTISSTSWSTNEPIHLPTLSSLSVQYWSRWSTGPYANILDRLLTPALVFVAWITAANSESPESDIDFSSLASLLERSQCPTRIFLAAALDSFDSESIARLFRAMPDLQELTLTITPRPELPSILALLSRTSGAILLPRLTYLLIKSFFGSREDEHTFMISVLGLFLEDSVVRGALICSPYRPHLPSVTRQTLRVTLATQHVWPRSPYAYAAGQDDHDPMILVERAVRGLLDRLWQHHGVLVTMCDQRSDYSFKVYDPRRDSTRSFLHYTEYPSG